MKLRKLEQKDAPYMLEWMHDPKVVEYLKANFAAKTIEDCENFIQAAQDMTTDAHLAVVDDKDEYMGTVSLKHICDGSAEFGITMRAVAQGGGFAKFGIAEIIRYGFERLGLHTVYWCVRSDNARAVRFYDKNAYERRELTEQLLALVREKGGYSEEEIASYVWYISGKDHLT